MRDFSNSFLFAITLLMVSGVIVAQQPPTASTGCVSGNCVNGYGKFIYSADKIYEGDWVNGQHHGKGTYTLKKDVVYTGQFANDKFNGKGKFTFASGDIYEGDFVNDKREGQEPLPFQTGVISPASIRMTSGTDMENSLINPKIP